MIDDSCFGLCGCKLLVDIFYFHFSRYDWLTFCAMWLSWVTLPISKSCGNPIRCINSRAFRNLKRLNTSVILNVSFASLHWSSLSSSWLSLPKWKLNLIWRWLKLRIKNRTLCSSIQLNIENLQIFQGCAKELLEFWVGASKCPSIKWFIKSLDLERTIQTSRLNNLERFWDQFDALIIFSYACTTSWSYNGNLINGILV